MCKRCRCYRKVIDLKEEAEFAITAAEAGLAPRFIKYYWNEDDSITRPGILHTECWEYDLENAARLLAAGFWSEEWRNELCDAIKRLPDMLDSLHLLGIIHRDLACRNIVIRRNAANNGWDIAFIDFGSAESSCRKIPQYGDYLQLIASIHYMATVLRRDLCAEMNLNCSKCGNLLKFSEF